MKNTGHFVELIFVICLWPVILDCLYSEQEQKSVPGTHIEADEAKAEPLTVIEQSELITPQPTTNQAMKGTVVLLLN